jgi:hypothetical protein
MAWRRFLVMLFVILFVAVTSGVCLAMIEVGSLTKVTAKEKYGITMHARQNGEAGIKVWLEKFTYAQLEMADENDEHMISAMLQPTPIYHQQAEDLTTVSFSADASQLSRCRFGGVC